MFRDDPQRAKAIRLMLPPHMRRLWSATGPTESCCRWIEQRSFPLSRGEIIMLKVAFDFWNGCGHTDFGQLYDSLDGRNARAVATLLVAAVEGGDAVDAWIEQWDVDGRHDGEP